MTALRTLAYISTATRELSQDELLRVGYGAQRFNETVGVTGLLVFDSRQFAQVIEGSSEAITEVFARIEKDDLHREIRVFVDEPVHRRIYTDWAMLTSIEHGSGPVRIILQFALEKGTVTRRQGKLR